LAEFLALVVVHFAPSLKDNMVKSITKAANDAVRYTLRHCSDFSEVNTT
jgi:hypothetical protein